MPRIFSTRYLRSSTSPTLNTPESVSSSASSRTRSRAGRRGVEVGEIAEAERAFDRVHLLDRVFEAVTTEFVLLDLLEPLAEIAELLVRHRRLPRGKDDRVLARGVRLVHSREGLEHGGDVIG